MTNIKPYSDARRQRDKHYPDARQAVYERADGRCEAKLWGCTVTAEQVHHRRGRVPIDGDDPHDLELLMAVCMACHDWIGDHPDAARQAGLLLSRLGEVRPSRWAQTEEAS